MRCCFNFLFVGHPLFNGGLQQHLLAVSSWFDEVTTFACIYFDIFPHFRILWKKNEVADYQATNYSIFYNNALFLALVVLCSFFVFKTMSPNVNYVLSMGIASGLVALLSTGTK